MSIYYIGGRYRMHGLTDPDWLHLNGAECTIWEDGIIGDWRVDIDGIGRVTLDGLEFNVWENCLTPIQDLGQIPDEVMAVFNQPVKVSA